MYCRITCPKRWIIIKSSTIWLPKSELSPGRRARRGSGMAGWDSRCRCAGLCNSFASQPTSLFTASAIQPTNVPGSGHKESCPLEKPHELCLAVVFAPASDRVRTTSSSTRASRSSFVAGRVVAPPRISSIIRSPTSVVKTSHFRIPGLRS